MGKFYKKELTDYSEDELFSLLKNPIGVDKKRLTEIMDELKRRGHTTQVDDIENELIKSNSIYSKIWNRIGAYLIDVMILGLIGYILGLFLGGFFIQIGEQGILIGFLIAIVYFGFGNSGIFNGQTFGKKILKLQVTDCNLNTLPIAKSILRALIYTIPYFFLNYKLESWSEFSLFYIAKGIIFLTFLIILPIHLIINKPTRQAIHDIILGTFVVSLEAYPRQSITKSKSLPTLIAGGLTILLLASMIIMNLRNNETTSIVHQLKPLKEQIDNIEGVGNSLLAKHTRTIHGVSKTEYLKLTIILKKDLISRMKVSNIENLDFVKKAIKVILRDYQDVHNLDQIQVNLVYGYSIGISKSTKSIGYTNTIENWRKTIK